MYNRLYLKELIHPRMPPPDAPAPADEAITLYGKDPTPRIVDVQALGAPGDPGPARVRIYRRTEDGAAVEAEDAPFYPFFFLKDSAPLRGMPRSRVRCSRLQGENPYRYVAAFRAMADYWDGLRRAERADGGVYRVPNPAQQYLMQSGRTLFKGMRFEDLHRMQIDIEVYSESGFPDAARPEDAVILVGLSDNRGWRRILRAPEPQMLAEMIALIRARDPDVIEGHNLYGFDLPYLMQRCERYGIPFGIGRDGSAPRTFPSSMRFAERSVEFQALDVVGRHIVDTYFQVMSFDVVKRNLPGYSLKAAARYFGIAPPDRVYIDGADIARVWREEPARLERYLEHDLAETEALARRLSGASFYLAQMTPMPYGQIARTGPAGKIESLFVREYLRRRHSLPAGEVGTQALGGYTDVFVTGVVGPIVYADVESLYPSIMLNYDVRPRTDALGLFPDLLRRLTALRLDAKRRMQDDGEMEARQGSYKILINAFYGSLGFSQALFNDFREADRVASIGQELLRSMIEHLRRFGGEVIEVDTDGVLFVPPPACASEADERRLVERLNAEMPPGIRIGYEGRFQRMLSYKKKNYALLTYTGEIKFKGSSLVSRSVERFGRQFVREGIRLLLAEDVAGLHALYVAARERITAHAWQSADDFSRTETLKTSLAAYQADVAAGRRTRAAAYELALARRARGLPAPGVGDRMSYYIAGAGAGVTASEACREADAWDPRRPDENTAYYLKRLDEVTAKFEPFFAPHDFRMIFSMPDMFGFSAEGIRVRKEVREAAPIADVPF